MSTSSPTYFDQLCDQLRQQSPFQLLDSDLLDSWLANSKLLRLQPGQTLLSPRQLQDRIYLVIPGQVRLLVEVSGEIITIDRRGSGQCLGWVSLLRGSACEWVSASEETTVLALSAQTFLQGIGCCPDFSTWFSSLPQQQETHFVASAALELMPQRFQGWRTRLTSQLANASVCNLSPEVPFKAPDTARPGTTWHLSTSEVPGIAVGTLLVEGQLLPTRSGFQLPYRLVGLPPIEEIVVDAPFNSLLQDGVDPLEDALPSASLHQLGILDGDELQDDFRYPLVRGNGVLPEAMAACEMIALVQRVPFRRDSVKKVLEDQFRRDKSLSLELLGGLLESLGLRTQLGSVENAYLGSLEAPAVLMLEGTPVVLFQMAPNAVVLGHPRSGLVRESLESFQKKFGETVRFALPRRIGTTPTSRFWWSLLTPMG